MTLKKKPLSRDYSTFTSPSDTAENSQKSPSDTSRRSVGLEAQRLASRAFWAEDPQNNESSSAVPNMGAQEEGYRREEDPSDPPPIYTPSETTADNSSTPPSPALARSQPEVNAVRQFPSSGSPTHTAIPEEENQEEPTQESYATSPLLERAQSLPDGRPSRCPRWGSETHKRRPKRLSKACWFAFAVAALLWIMLPALCPDNVLLFTSDTAGAH
jgi:hypothetical protein